MPKRKSWFKHQKHAGIHPKPKNNHESLNLRFENQNQKFKETEKIIVNYTQVLNPRNKLKEYQRICDKIKEAEESVKAFLDAYRENRGKWQESIRNKNEAIKEMLEFHGK